MDGTRFDALTRAVARQSSRRTFLKAALAGAAGMLAPGLRNAVAGGPRRRLRRTGVCGKARTVPCGATYSGGYACCLTTQQCVEDLSSPIAQGCLPAGTRPCGPFEDLGFCLADELCAEDGTCLQCRDAELSCGRDCPPCPHGGKCRFNSDCLSNVCKKNVCVDQCNDGIQNGFEGDVDCGGPCPKKCGFQKGCFSDSDCASGFCIDAKCGCASDAECVAYGGPYLGCDFDSHQCIGHCLDHHLSGDESDVDCGGSCPEKCTYGKGCFDNPDCASGICIDAKCRCKTDAECEAYDPGQGLVCRDNHYCGWHCLDGNLSGDESDVDCGGSCEKCEDGKTCKTNEDCQSNKCDGSICAAGVCPNPGIHTVIVPATAADWLDSGIDVDARCEVWVSASGLINVCFGSPNQNDCWVGPEGKSFDHCACSGVGRVLHVGSNDPYLSNVVTEPRGVPTGRQYFMVYDTAYEDNVGVFTVTIDVR